MCFNANQLFISDTKVLLQSSLIILTMIVIFYLNIYGKMNLSLNYIVKM